MKLINKPGVYRNYNGRIEWKKTTCLVRNADFDINEQRISLVDILFHDVVIDYGLLFYVEIENGLNFRGQITLSKIEYVINNGGIVSNCIWRDGIFDGGIFKYGRWFGGIWIKGNWYDSRDEKGVLKKNPPNEW